MRILVAIPHYFGPSDRPSLHGSEAGDRATRLRVVNRCLAALHETFGPRQKLCSDINGSTWPASNTAMVGTLDLVLCTTGDEHLAADLLPMFQHFVIAVEKRALGFVCHHVLRENFGNYDYYCYLEDDLEITDALFFDKLAWFSSQFGAGALLQPNRFEADPTLVPAKLYIDGNLADPAMQARHQDITVERLLTAGVLGREWVFQRVDNVHSGCFFLNAAQFAHAMAQPEFGVPTGEFIGPLESAATLMAMRSFAAYKPARENAGFLEVRHLDNRMLLPPRGPAPA